MIATICHCFIVEMSQPRDENWSRTSLRTFLNNAKEETDNLGLPLRRFHMVLLLAPWVAKTALAMWLQLAAWRFPKSNCKIFQLDH